MTDDELLFPITVLWRRIDVEGMDGCTFDLSGDGYVISGTAIYLDGIEPAKFDYTVACNADWSSQSASVSGWLGQHRKEFTLSRGPNDVWTIDGEVKNGLSGLVDIDLGFTPATNTNAIRRLGLAVGEDVETTAVWLDTESWCFKPLRQVYRRLSDTEIAYCSPAHDYAATLVTDGFGIVRRYPHLWAALPEKTARRD